MSHRAQAVAWVIAAASLTTLTPQPARPEARVAHGAGLAAKKGVAADAPDADCPLLSTLDQVHTGELVPLDVMHPTQEEFEELLADRVTGSKHAMDDRLLTLLRALASEHPGGRIELVSGYRSPKLNEMLRKKGHHVSAHSQHSLGHACDFRIIPVGDDVGLDPRVVEREIRDLGWDGGVGVYLAKDDWFVHADVGRNRRWLD